MKITETKPVGRSFLIEVSEKELKVLTASVGRHRYDDLKDIVVSPDEHVEFYQSLLSAYGDSYYE